MREYCIKNNLHIKRCGKVVVTKTRLKKKHFMSYMKEAKIIVILKYLVKKNYQNMNFRFNYKKFLWSPNTWSVCPVELFNCLINECKSLNIKFSIGEKDFPQVLIYKDSNKNKFILISSKCMWGFFSYIAEKFGITTNYKLLPFKGLYLKSSKKLKIFKRHIYPVPNIINHS